MEETTILIVDDEQYDLTKLEGFLKKWNYIPLPARNGAEALEILIKKPVDLIISDQEMEGMNGLELLNEVKKQYPMIPFIILTAYGSIEKAVAAIRQEADDYLQKDYNPGELQIRIERLLEHNRVITENRNLKNYLSRRYGVENIIAASPQMQRILESVEQVSSTDATVLICGETGTGKELIAGAVHSLSNRQSQPLVTVDCAALSATLIESQLFGHEKGAFTGANSRQTGLFELANGGTIFLDEIGELTPDLQAKLLRVLQEGEFKRLGNPRTIKVNVRVIAATNRDLKKEVEHGKFREDLFFRLNVFPIHLPLLRERAVDIPLLVNHFVERFQKKHGKHIRSVSEEAMQMLSSYHWPGNVRELEHRIERAVIKAGEGQIRLSHLDIPKPDRIRDDVAGTDSPGITIGEKNIRLVIEIEKERFSLKTVINHTLQNALNCCDNMSNAAKLLRVKRDMFYRRGMASGNKNTRNK